MKQLVQDLKSGETRVVEAPVPKAGAGQVLVRVRASAVSAGTERMLVDFAQSGLLGKAKKRPDLFRQALQKARRDGILTAWQSAQSRLSEPLALGYSCAGIVEEIGEGVEGFKPGDRVACAGAGYAGHAEFVGVPQNLCVLLPADGPSFEEGAFVTLGAIALQGFRLGAPQLGESVAVVGLGLLGQMAVQLAKASGLKVWGTDLNAKRLELAKSLGLDAGAPRPDAEESARRFTQGRGFDLVLIAADASSSDPVELAGAIARDRGTIVAIGNVPLHAPRDLYYRKELTLKVSRSYGPGRYDPVYEEGGVDYPYGHVRWTEGRNMEEVVRLLAEKKLLVSPLVTHRFPIEDGARAYELISGKAGEPYLGVVLTYPERSPLQRKIVLARETRSAGPAPNVAAVQGVLGVGVLGAGAFASSVFLPILKNSGARLVSISAGSGLRARSAAERFGFSAVCSEDAEVLSDPAVSAAAILTRHHRHAAQILAALEKGKHVFVEKPLCLSREELDQIAKVKELARGTLLTVGFNRRFASMSAALKEFIGAVSGPKSVRVRVNAGELPANHWLIDPAQGGGRLVGEGCHFIDWANFVVGSAPVETDAKPLGKDPGEQDWSLRLSYADGSLAEIVYLSHGPWGLGKERYEASAGERSAVLEDFRSLVLSSSRSRKVRRSWFRADKGHAAHWAAFARAAASGGPSPIPWSEIAASMETVFAAQDSLRQGRPIALTR